MERCDIHKLCSYHNIQQYVIGPNNGIDVIGDVNLSNMKLGMLPILFNKVTGCFSCCHNNITTLDGFPIYVGGDLCIESNPIQYTSANFDFLTNCEVGGQMYMENSIRVALCRHIQIMKILL